MFCFTVVSRVIYFLSCFGAGVTYFIEPFSSFLLPLHNCGLGAGSILFRATVNKQQAMRDEAVIYVAGHPLLNRRCTRVPGCIRLQHDLYCIRWGVKLYSLTPSDLWSWGQGFHSHPLYHRAIRLRTYTSVAKQYNLLPDKTVFPNLFCPSTQNRTPMLGRYPAPSQSRTKNDIFHRNAHLFRLHTQLKGKQMK